MNEKQYVNLEIDKEALEQATKSAKEYGRSRKRHLEITIEEKFKKKLGD